MLRCALLCAITDHGEATPARSNFHLDIIRSFILFLNYLTACHPERQRRLSISIIEVLRSPRHDMNTS